MEEGAVNMQTLHVVQEARSADRGMPMTLDVSLGHGRRFTP